MINREQLKQRYDAIHEHFTFRDFLGLSALVFGLLLSNSSFDPGPAKVSKTDGPQSQKEKPLKKNDAGKAPASKSKVRKKVIKLPPKKRQPITAAK